MTKLRSMMMLTIVTLAVVAAAVFLQQPRKPIDSGSELLFPNLLQQLKDITRIDVHSASDAFELVRSQTQWLLATKGNYKADQDRIHQLLIGLTGLVRIEPLTSKAERYHQLGLATTPTASSDGALKIELFDSKQQSTVALLLGNRRNIAGNEQIYVRLDDDPQAWLVEGKLPDSRAMIDWLERTIIDLKSPRIRDVRVQHANEQLFVFRPEPLSEDFNLEGIPADKTLKSQWQVNYIGRFLEELRFDSLIPRSQQALQSNPNIRLTATTFDGLQIEIDIFHHDDTLLAQFNAHADRALHQELELPAAGDSANEVYREALDAQLSFEQVQAEAAAFSSLWENWAYELSEYKVDSIDKTLSDLVEDKTDPSSS